MQLDRVFDALASRPRREILAYLSKAELTTSELAERFSISGRMEAVSFRRKSRGEDAGWQLRGDAVDQTAACRAFRVSAAPAREKFDGRGLSLFFAEGAHEVPLIYINLPGRKTRNLADGPREFVERFLSCSAIFSLLLPLSFCSPPA